MNWPRRRFIRLASSALAGPALARVAHAQAYPTRLVHLIVGFPAGGPTDIVARLIGQWLSERFGQQLVIENRPGAGSNLATAEVVRAPADGYTLLLVGTPAAINATLYSNPGFVFLRDIAPVGSIMRVPNVMVVSPSFPAATVPEFIAYARANPGKINMASGGSGGSPHVAGELFKMMTGVDMIHVPYRGSPSALSDLIGGQVQVMFDVMPTSIDLIRAGKLRALAVTSAMRSEALAGIPALDEFVPGYEASSFHGLGVPKETPAVIIKRLNTEINSALADAKFSARLADLGGTALGGSPSEFGALIAEETEKWAKVVRFSGARPE